MQYSTGQAYSKVCGRIIGYQFKTPDAFHQYNAKIDFDGMNITRGAQRDHIWSYVAGHTHNALSDCPRSSNSESRPPLSIGDRYYCESGAPTDVLRDDDPLWDGQHCEGTCRTGTNSPPWFSVQLHAPTTDTIDVSICCDQDTNDEDVPVGLIEIYVQ